MRRLELHLSLGKNTGAIVVFGIGCALTGRIYRGARFVLPHG